MYIFFRTSLLLISASFLFFALISPVLLENVTIHFKDALIIVVYVILSNFAIRLISIFETKKLEEKVILQYSQMQVILDNSPLFICLKDLDGKILLANKAYCELVNMKLNDIIGKKSYELYKEADILEKEDLDVIKSKTTLSIDKYVDSVTGKFTWYRIIKVPIFDKFDNVVRLAVIFRNIDNEKELELRKETFVATLTHDLKTPTIAQIKILDLLLQDTFGPLNNEQKEMIEQIKNSCKYMYDLIFTILDTYMIDNGQIKVKFEKFDVVDVTTKTINELANLAQEKSQRLNLINKLEDPRIFADKSQIKRVIVNLISNAISYAFKDTDINIIISENEDNFECCVQNKAYPIKQEMLENMFVKFKRSENAKFQKTRNGLGLYLSKEIISAHSGEIYATSDEDGICTICFSIPKNLANVKQV